jgi:hypothetical protein
LVALFGTLGFECGCLLFPADVELYDPSCNIKCGSGGTQEWPPKNERYLMTDIHLKLMKHDLVIGLKNDIIFEKNKLCSACQAGKQIGNTHPTKSVMSTSRPLELLHMDLFDPTTYRSIDGNSYGLVVVVDYSRYTWVFFLSDKSNVFSIFKVFAKRAKNEFDFKMKKI